MRPAFLLLFCAACAVRPAQPAAPAPQPPPSVAPAPEPAATTTTTLAEAPLPAADEPHDDEEADPDAAETEPIGPAPPPASRYAALDRDACEAELAKRKVPFVPVETARGVVAPIRLDGPVSGVTFRSNLPASQRKTAVIEIYDCRLVLALDDFAKILAKHDVTEVVHLSVYRPVGKKGRLKNGVGRRHGGALAIDAAIFKTKDGKVLDVKKDFHGRIGTRTCPPPSSASELRRIACEASDARLFNVLLTPDYNWAHRNHFHLEVTSGARWFFVR